MYAKEYYYLNIFIQIISLSKYVIIECVIIEYVIIECVIIECG